VTTTETTDPLSDYAPPEERPPLAAYATFAAVFHGAMAGAVTAAKRSGRDLPEHVHAGDIALIGTASYQLSRLIAKKKVTAFVRAPFTELEGKGGPAELEEHPRGRGLRRALGEMLVCPYCFLWASGGFHGAPVRAARDASAPRSRPPCRSGLPDRVPLGRAAGFECRRARRTGTEVGLERELAVVGDHLRPRVPHGLLELVRHGLLKVSTSRTFVTMPVVHERLHPRHRLLEHADEDAVVSSSSSPRGPPAAVAAEQLRSCS
jgi:hypothetical protein